jgi:hypothetical protein
MFPTTPNGGLSAPGAYTSSDQVRKLDDQQANFARNYLSLPPTTPAYAAKAELGLLDYDLASGISKVLLHHRIHTNNDEFLHTRSGECTKCRAHQQSEAHLLWACTATSPARATFSATTRVAAPTAWRGLCALPLQDAFHFLMGAGAKTVSEGEWKNFQREAVRYVAQAFSTLEGL